MQGGNTYLKEGELKEQTQDFLKELSPCLLKDRNVIIIMDAEYMNAIFILSC